MSQKKTAAKWLTFVVFCGKRVRNCGVTLRVLNPRIFYHAYPSLLIHTTFPTEMQDEVLLEIIIERKNRREFPRFFGVFAIRHLRHIVSVFSGEFARIIGKNSHRAFLSLLLENSTRHVDSVNEKSRSLHSAAFYNHSFPLDLHSSECSRYIFPAFYNQNILFS